ncbi:heptaprenyl diphosphate synthase component 1 [Evansella cellulosilytica]|uniref:Heptaprenyl diphosphate synthase component I (Spore germination protein C1) n=1 Tax=Evansella cellulosilytica (strain ATCC 21833 / DSM 2522 / FERM P-1141 / JCM 9156 / N-4) TaxID=649639 RepID=E6TZF3_EVAC2|nr:heptaprenyl diphosphate synthase component 1 [Evansella cellulosilytica]ADU30127.1 heptaprenyl diphosphate synthase component I (spore germination protein C1) [Evansella cellulosilytica DSM 2522]
MSSTYLYSEELKSIIDSFYTKIKHPYLQKYIEDPQIDADQAVILYMMLKEKKVDQAYISQCILTTILVQAALDTHEQVSVDELQNETNRKKRQLKVLAGDYYSSLYYSVLSKVDDVTLIKVLAKSIQEINESKMNVYKNKIKKIQAGFDDVRTIDTSLLRNIANMLQMSEWKNVIEEFFFLKRLLKERFLWLDKGMKGSLVDMLLYEVSETDKNTEYRGQLLARFDRHIEVTKDKLLHISKDWVVNATFLQKRVHELLVENKYEHWVMEEG